MSTPGLSLCVCVLMCREVELLKHPFHDDDDDVRD
jgi:hypothetical protein